MQASDGVGMGVATGKHVMVWQWVWLQANICDGVTMVVATGKHM